MTVLNASVSFHTGVEDLPAHAVKVIRKALAQGLRVCTVGPDPLIRALDELLWTHEPGSFLPHVKVEPTTPVSVLDRSAVMLVDQQTPVAQGALARRDVWVGLAGERVADPAAMPKIIEIVGTSPEQRRSGQSLWRQYRELGITPAHHAVGS